MGIAPRAATVMVASCFGIGVRLARREEQDAGAEFGEAYAKYAAEVPGFVPKPGRLLGQPPTDEYRHG